jgi:hypothetical protein
VRYPSPQNRRISEPLTIVQEIAEFEFGKDKLKLSYRVEVGMGRLGQECPVRAINLRLKFAAPAFHR